MNLFLGLASSKFHTFTVMSAQDVTRHRSDSTWQRARGTAFWYMEETRVPVMEE
jgi:hypothetical protein